MKHFLIVCLALGLCNACGEIRQKFGRDDKSTTVVFRHPEQAYDDQLGAMVALTGGVMVYGFTVDATNFRGSKKLIDEFATDTLWSVPMGRYRFFAIGYSGGITGTMYCGVTSEIDLNLLQQNVSIPVLTSRCQNPPFVPDSSWLDGSLNIRTMTIKSCASSVDIAPLTPGASCGTNGIINSVRISLPEYFSKGGEIMVPQNAGNLESACLPLTTGVVATSVHVPIGMNMGQDDPFVMGINAYTDIGCSAGKRLYGFGRGLIRAADNNSMRFESSAGIFSPGSTIHAKAGPFNTSEISIHLKDF